MRPKIGSSYRYAKAFLSILSKVQQDAFVKKIEMIQMSLRDLLDDPHFKHLHLQGQEQILEEWAIQWKEPFFASFIKLILENDRRHDLLEILQCVYEQYCDQRNVRNIGITTSKPLKRNEKKKLEESLKQKGNIKYTIDEYILGGTIIKIDGKLKDESLRSYLQDIQTKLMEVL